MIADIWDDYRDLDEWPMPRPCQHRNAGMVTPAIGTLPLRTAAAWIGGGARRSCPGGHVRHAVDVQRDCQGLPIKARP